MDSKLKERCSCPEFNVGGMFANADVWLIQHGRLSMYGVVHALKYCKLENWQPVFSTDFQEMGGHA